MLKKTIITLGIILGVASLGIAYYIYQPVVMSVGSVTTILGTDKMSDSRTTINDNFSYLDANKMGVGTTTIPTLTTASNLVTVGALSSGSLTTGFTVIGVPQGGTGVAAMLDNQVLLGNGTGAIDKVSGLGTSGQFLTSNGAGTPPTWQTSAIDESLDYHWTGEHIFDDALIASSTITNLTIPTMTGTDITIANLTVTGTKTGIASTTDITTFTSDGTWTKPTGAIKVCVQAWGGGGGGGSADSDAGNDAAGGGGGGGAYKEFCFDADDLGATEAVDVGAGGAAATAGSNTTFDILIAYGGGAGVTADASATTNGGGGGGGGSKTKGETGTSGDPAATGGVGGGLVGSAAGDNNGAFGGAGGGANATVGGSAVMGGAGGGGGNYSAGGGAGGASIYGGGGGGGGCSPGSAAGGASVFGGNGGAGGSSNTNGTVGTQPAGGGGGAGRDSTGTSTGGAGGDGQVIVTTYF